MTITPAPIPGIPSKTASRCELEPHAQALIAMAFAVGLLIVLFALVIHQIPTHHASLYVPLDGTCTRVEISYPGGSFDSAREAWAHKQGVPLSAVGNC